MLRLHAVSTAMTPSGSVVTMGETMALLDAPASGRLGGGSALPVGIGGAESNVAIGLARLGWPARWISRVGDDAFGPLVTREIRAEGVRVIADRDPDAPTGLMVKEHRGGRPWRVRYYRAGSAASRLSPADLDAGPDDIAEADVLHLTGITAALGAVTAGRGPRAIEIARAAGTLVSFDVNHRATLWSADEAAPVLAPLAAAADLVFAGPEEAALLLGRDARTADVRRRRAAGPGAGQTRPGHRRGQARRPRRAGPVRRPGAPGAGPAGHGRRRGRRRRCLRRGLPQRTRRRRDGRPTPAHGQPCGGAVCQSARRLGGPAHPRRTATTDPRSEVVR